MLRKGQVTAIEDLSKVCDFREKKILEIGGDIKHEVANYLIDQGAAHITSINISPQVSTQEINDKLTTVNLDATKLTSYFDNETFDMAFGVAILEHIDNTKLLLEQLYSVLKYNGFALLHGGPIWTSKIGHHTWVECDETVYRFSDSTNPIPHWHHLLLKSDEMIEYLTTQKHLPHHHAEKIAKYIYEGSDLSRMTYLDFINAFKNSKFEIVDILKNSEKNVPNNVLKKLSSSQYDNLENFAITGLKFIISKTA